MTAKKRVIVDTDFMEYMNRPNDGSGLFIFEKIVNDLDIEIVVHEFLYNKEMMGNPMIKKLEEKKLLTVIKFDDFIGDNEDKLYMQLFEDMYKHLNGREIKWNNGDHRTYQESSANLGEIHCVILSMFTGYDIIFSNDGGTKSLVDVKVNSSIFKITVKNIMDVFRELAIKDKKNITRGDFIKLTKGDKHRKKDITEIKELWK